MQVDVASPYYYYSRSNAHAMVDLGGDLLFFPVALGIKFGKSISHKFINRPL